MELWFVSLLLIIFSGPGDAVALFVEEVGVDCLRRRRIIKAKAIPRKATPPTVPPTIGPTFDFSLVVAAEVGVDEIVELDA